MIKDNIISAYFENMVFAGVRVTLGDEDFVIAPKDYKDGKKMPWKEAMDVLDADNLTTWNYRQACLTMAYYNEINRVLYDNGGKTLYRRAYWTSNEYSHTCSSSYYGDVLSYDYKHLALRVRLVKNLKTK